MPGELGHGLNQDYAGNLLAASFGQGITIRRPDGWIVEPQMRIIYTRILQDSFADNLGATVTVKRGQSLAGSLGVKLLRKAAGGELWLQAAYRHEFCRPNLVDVAGDTAVDSVGRNAWLINLGADWALSHRLSIRGEAGRLFGGERGYRGSLTMQYLL